MVLVGFHLLFGFNDTIDKLFKDSFDLCKRHFNLSKKILKM